MPSSAGKKNIINQPTKKRDVGARANRHIQVAHRRRAREPWVNVNQRRAALASFHGQTKANRVRFGAVRCDPLPNRAAALPSDWNTARDRALSLCGAD